MSKNAFNPRRCGPARTCGCLTRSNRKRLLDEFEFVIVLHHDIIFFVCVCVCVSLLPEALGLLDGEQQFLFELLVAFVRRQVEAVKAARGHERRSHRCEENVMYILCL